MKVLFAGLGSIGQRHLRNLKTLLGERVQVMAFRTHREEFVLSDRLTIESEGGLEQRFDLRVFTDLDSALAQRPDVVFVTNPSSLHMPVAVAAARAWFISSSRNRYPTTWRASPS